MTLVKIVAAAIGALMIMVVGLMIVGLVLLGACAMAPACKGLSCTIDPGGSYTNASRHEVQASMDSSVEARDGGYSAIDWLIQGDAGELVERWRGETP